jgi:hypothetical protein
MNTTRTKNDDKNTKLQNTNVVAIFRVLVQALIVTFLGELVKFRRAAISFVMSVRLSLRPSVRPSVRLSA